MTVEIEAEEPSASVELWVPGSAVVARGVSEDGRDSVAIWQVSPQGAPTGAWVVPAAEAFGEESTARQLLTFVERRGITGLLDGDLEALLEQLTVAAGVDANRWWGAQLFSPVVAFGEIVARRGEVEKIVAGTTAVKNVTEVGWPTDLAGGMVRDVEDLRRIAGVGAAPGDHPVEAALVLSRVLRWLVRRWVETEQVKNRRDYVRDALGEPQALPPSWLAAVQTASTNVLPL